MTAHGGSSSTLAVPRRVASVGPVRLLQDSWIEALRHLRAMPRSPELLVYAAIQPVMFVVLFVYVLGGAIVVPDYDDYRQFLIPGIFAQTVLWGSTFTGVGVAEDLGKGIVDRLRSLPMSQSAVLVGRTLSDLVRNLLTFTMMFALALLVGFRFEGTVPGAIGATLLLLVFSHSFSWIQAWIGLSVKNAEAANSGGFIWMFPITFVSSAFVDPRTMPGWLQPIAEHNPFTTLTNATRALYNGREAGNDPWVALAWAVGITIVFMVISTRKFAGRVNR